MLDLVVIGAGPAGITAALYAGRSKLKTKVFEKLGVGGQLLLTEHIENYPGIYQMKSNDWIDIAKKQLVELKSVELAEDIKVESIECKDGFFNVFFSSQSQSLKQSVETRSVIVASGAQPKRLNLVNEVALTGRGVSYCATCDGPFFKDKEVVVIGGGDTAIEEALYLTRFAKKVTIVHRREELRATAILKEKATSNEKIAFKWESLPVEIIGSKKVEGLKIENVKTAGNETIPCDGVFIFVGFVPDTDFLKNLTDLDKDGYVLTDEEMMSSCDGLFACGDCRKRALKQVVTACGEGALAEYHVEKFLQNKI